MFAGLNSDTEINSVIFYTKMEQQHLNKSDYVQLGDMEISEAQQNNSSIEEAKFNNVSKQGKIPQKEISAMEQNGNVRDSLTTSKGKYIKTQLTTEQVNEIIDDKPAFLSDKILDKKLKIKHNKKCSGCLKKHLNQNVVSCLNCPKSYHRSCLSSSNFKIVLPFVCQNCQEILKERHIRKSTKKQSNTLKQTQLRKLPKIEDRVTNSAISIEDNNSLISTELQLFAQRFPLYFQNGRITFPIEDSLLEEYTTIVPRVNTSSKPLPTKTLPSWFGTILEGWNTVQTFDEDLTEHSRLSISELSELMENKNRLIVVEKLFINLLDFVCRDIFNERFQVNKSFLGNPFLCLLKYCTETGSLSRIFKYVWVELLYQISSLSEFSVIFRDSKMISLVQKLRVKTNQHWTPTAFENRILLLQSILNGIVQSTSYHDDLYLKIEKGKQNIRLKNDSIQKAKQIEYQLRSIAERKKEITKEIRNSNKQMNHFTDKSKFQKEIQKLGNDQKKIESEEIKLKQTLQIQRENISLVSNGISYTNVWFLGKDREHRDYWFIPNHRDRLFVNEDSKKWYQYDLSTISELMKSLNTKGIRQKQLYQNLVEYKRNNYFGNINQSSTSEMPSIYEEQRKYEEDRKKYLETSAQVDFDKQEFISFEFIRKILLLGEKKMFNYLDEKNARWGSPEDRQAFITKIKQASTNKDMIEAAKFLNEKICVVEIEYIVINDEGQEVTDFSKMRKVQTKMWGINEKYKHAWLQYLVNCDENQLIEVFFLNAILYLTIDRYVSKMRDPKKPKRDFADDAASSNENKILNKKSSNQKKGKNKIEWQQTCHVCNLFGELLCCDLCPKVFHLNCIGLEQIPDGNYQCKQCESKRHTRSITRKIVQVD